MAFQNSSKQTENLNRFCASVTISSLTTIGIFELLQLQTLVFYTSCPQSKTNVKIHTHKLHEQITNPVLSICNPSKNFARPKFFILSAQSVITGHIASHTHTTPPILNCTLSSTHTTSGTSRHGAPARGHRWSAGHRDAVSVHDAA